MKKILLALGIIALLTGNQSFVIEHPTKTNHKVAVAGDEITFKIKNDSGGSLRIQFKGTGGDSGTTSMNSSITTEYKKFEGCKVYNAETEKLLFVVSSDMAGKTLKISDYQ